MHLFLHFTVPQKDISFHVPVNFFPRFFKKKKNFSFRVWGFFPPKISTFLSLEEHTLFSFSTSFNTFLSRLVLHELEQNEKQSFAITL